MRIFSVLSVLLLSCASFAAAALVQAKSVTTNGATSLTLGSGAGWAASSNGNLVVVVVDYQTSTTVPTLTDNLGNVICGSPPCYTLDYSFQTNRIRVYSLPSNPGGITSFTVSGGGFDLIVLSAFEYSGMAASSPFVTSAAGKDNGFGAASWSSNTTGTTDASGGIVLAIAYDWRTNTTLSLSSAGYTSEASTGGSAGWLGIWDKPDSGSATYSVNGTGGSGSGQIVVGIVVYKASGGGGGPAPPQTLMTLGAGIAKLEPNNVVPLMGISSTVAIGLPLISRSDGYDQGPTDRALLASVDALAKDGLMVPDKTDDSLLTASKNFALQYASAIRRFGTLGFSSPLVDATQVVLKLDTASGVTDWAAVERDLNTLTDFGYLQGWLRPGSAKLVQVKSFLLDFAHIVDAYNRSGDGPPR